MELTNKNNMLTNTLAVWKSPKIIFVKLMKKFMGKGKLYTEEEVKSLITKAFNDAFNYGHYDEQFVFVDGVKINNDADYWIEQNLNQNKNNGGF